MARMLLYYERGSPPCAAVYMTAKTLGIDLKIQNINLLTGEHLKPEFLALNPQHTIPTLVDNGFSIWESRAIMIYLTERYGKTDDLYPKDTIKRAIINQRLFFDIGTLYQRYINCYLGPIFGNRGSIPEDFEKLKTAVGFFNEFLQGSTYAAGETLTLADIALYATMICFTIVDFDFMEYPNVKRWYDVVDKRIPGAEENRKSAAVLKSFL